MKQQNELNKQFDFNYEKQLGKLFGKYFNVDEVYFGIERVTEKEKQKKINEKHQLELTRREKLLLLKPELEEKNLTDEEVYYSLVLLNDEIKEEPKNTQ